MADRLRCLPVLRRTIAATSFSLNTCSFGSRAVISVIGPGEGELLVPIPANRHENSGFAEFLNSEVPEAPRTHPFSRPPAPANLIRASEHNCALSGVLN